MALSDRDRDAAARKVLGRHGTLRAAVHEFERAKIAEAVALSHGNKKDAAILLGICREGLHVKIRKLGMKTKIAALGPDGRSKGRNGA